MRITTNNDSLILFQNLRDSIIAFPGKLKKEGIAISQENILLFPYEGISLVIDDDDHIDSIRWCNFMVACIWYTNSLSTHWASRTGLIRYGWAHMVKIKEPLKLPLKFLSYWRGRNLIIMNSYCLSHRWLWSILCALVLWGGCNGSALAPSHVTRSWDLSAVITMFVCPGVP